MSESESRSSSMPVGPLSEGDYVRYGVSVSEAGEFWMKLEATTQVRPGELGVQAVDRAEKFVDNMLRSHIQELRNNKI